MNNTPQSFDPSVWPFREGGDACHDGKGIDKNPYDEADSAHDEWDDGWACERKAMRERTKVMNGVEGGMSIRDHAAITFMAAYLSSPAMIDNFDPNSVKRIAAEAVKAADALFAELDKVTP